MNPKIDFIRSELWKKIEEHQSRGGSVRNLIMANRFGGQRGYGFEDSDTVCLLGLYDRYAAITGICQGLRISSEEALQLEAGFEKFNAWAGETAFYHLGREIGLQLEEKEEQKYAPTAKNAD